MESLGSIATDIQSGGNLILWLIPIIIIFAIWDIVWKAIGMWKSARNNHLAWFVCITIFNTIGILPIIYILMHRNKPTE